MEPSCTVGINANPPQAGSEKPDGEGWLPRLTLYLPYMSLESCKRYRKLQKQYRNNDKDNSYRIFYPDGTTQQHTHTIADYVTSTDVHPRRSLDQFYYPSLVDTSTRDADQTISKWTGNNLGNDGRETAAYDRALLMADQLWCWAIDDSKLQTAWEDSMCTTGLTFALGTIVSCFPYKNGSGSSPNYLGLYGSVRKNAVHCKTVWDLQALIVREAVGHLLEQNNKNVVDLIETYKWVSRAKITQGSPMKIPWWLTKHTKEAALDDSQEFKIALDVSDIIDELKMIRHLVQTQRDVLAQFIEALTRLYHSESEIRKDNHGDMPTTVFQHIEVLDQGQMFVNVQKKASVHHSSENTKLLAKSISGLAAGYVVTADETLLKLLVELDSIRDEAKSTYQVVIWVIVYVTTDD
ncbi:uncharacterized protein N0V89_010265 [Didymosphaeria variabile]|uniref:Uncharacterized protein n=1 Tax=Didymosphaeria variabile TaxID=1932322 RepID=A0A9W8XCZ0_9PLEO|nr:uncharacterized protein N0V89_010265 [Didymosphaeria variabile]KAJ4346336.1 hypothetical protein N0V89_010265 [Didymosphaeria variabile]